MQIPLIQSQPTFGYKWHVKTKYLRGQLPSVKIDASGRKLTPKNVSNDHIIPHSKGGKTRDDNLMLATKEFNQLRGNKPLGDFITVKGFAKHLAQYIDVRVGDFDGNEYILNVLRKVAKE